MCIIKFNKLLKMHAIFATGQLTSNNQALHFVVNENKTLFLYDTQKKAFHEKTVQRYSISNSFIDNILCYDKDTLIMKVILNKTGMNKNLKKNIEKS